MGTDPLKTRVLSDDESGMVGIGTMIVFIAMVIVASVAAGVLINTSNSLQQQARATGEETITEVSSGVKILAAKGKTNFENKIDNVILVVKPYAGSRGINLENTVIQYTSDYESKHYTYGETANENNFTVVTLQNVNGSQGTMLQEMGDISKIKIDIQQGLEPSDKASITIYPSIGFQSHHCILTPTTIRDNTWYEL